MEEVHAAVLSINAPGIDVTVRQHAIKFLEKFQNTVDAWNISLGILTTNPPHSQNELRFFAAQTLKHKIIVDFAQLDEAMIRTLKDALWNLCIDNPVEKQVGAQLFLALAAVIIQCPSEIWPSPVEELVGLAESSNNQSLVDKSLSVLSYIPEQLANPSIHLDSLQYQQVKRRLIELNIGPIVSLLGKCLSNNQVSREQTLNCLLNWIKYGASSPEIVTSEDILATAFSSIVTDLEQDNSTLDVTTELVCELFFRFFQVSETPSPSYLNTLTTGLSAIKPLLFKILADEDEESAHKVGRIFIEAGEAFLVWLLNDFSAMGSILECCLGLAEFKGDLKIVESTFSFWNSLETRLSEVNEGAKDPFISVFKRLFKSLIILHLSLPLDEGSWTAEERDNFRDFRHVIGDCLKDCVLVMGSTEALLIILELFKEVSAIPNVPWQRVEAVLFALRTISATIDRRESEAMPKIAQLLLQFSNSPKLVQAVILNIGCYAEWVRYHAEFLTPFLSFASAGLREHETASATAIKYLCESCKILLLPHELTFRSLYSQCLDVLAPKNLQDLSEAIANVLSVMSEDQLISSLPIYINPWISRLQSSPVAAMDNLSIFIEIVPKSSTMDNLLTQLIPFLPSILNFSSNEEAMTSLETLLRSITMNHQKFSIHLVEILDSMYCEHGIAGALYVLRGILMNEPPIIPYSRLQLSLSKIISFAETSNIGLLDLFHLTQTALDFYSELIFDPILTRVFPLAEKLLVTEPFSSNELSSAILLYSHLLQRLTNQNFPVNNHIISIFNQVVNTGIKLILQGLVNSYPLTVLSDCSSVIRRHFLFSSGTNLQLFSSLLASLPEGIMVSREKAVWMERYTTGVKAVRAREMKETMLNFVNVCRRRI